MPALACAAFTACAALTSCGDGSATTGPPPSSPAPAPSTTSPTGTPANDSPAGEKLVLRWRKTGGFAGVGGPGSVPEFSLYSSGRAVVSAGPPQNKLTEYRLKPEALKALLDGARAAGLGRSHTVGSEKIMDAFVTVITMGGATTRVIQAESQGGPEAAFLKRLDPHGWGPAELASPAKPYAPEKTAVLAGVAGGGAAKKWPLGPLAHGARVGGATCTLVPSSKVPASVPGTVWSSDGQSYSIRLRPLLPAESTCSDIA
ncbi:hypothetical protein GCM10022254_65590 [Actinomadura meridiana]|uniref:Lipoprotein n=1 Tax=Actinomadura meridiana TaxID=559626 RepID=A0ABP8CMA7_9ACTN